MKFIETEYFNQQLEELKGTYINVKFDYEDFKIDFKTDFSVNLGGGVYKARSKNSSIPVGKSGGLRFIVKAYNDVAVPMMVYAKSIKKNATEGEILEALEITVKELEKMGIIKK